VRVEILLARDPPHEGRIPEGDPTECASARCSAPAGTAVTPLALATGASAHADATDRTVNAGAGSPRGVPVGA
jgi:hypothetical protein